VTDLLFVYGTLMRDLPLHRLLQPAARYVGAGRVGGRLFDLGRYPAAIPDGLGTLHGELYRVEDPALWAVLDSVEGPQYHRGEARVATSDDDDPVSAFVYWYVGPLSGAVPIPGGDYRAHPPARSVHRL
jgi:gamma-glutamylcyclotransferase (GGCT)/AIG2-like uncharacterized protein YtfP